MHAYRTLEGRFARLGSIADVIGILHWDARTMMPDGAAEDRSNQLAVLNGIAHGLLSAPEIRDLLDEADQSRDILSPWQRANLREMQRAYHQAAALPGDLVEASARAVARAELVWREARQDSDFAQLQPPLATVLAFQRQIGQAKGDALGLAPYDALLDRYDAGLRQTQIDALFAELRADLPNLIQAARTAQEERAAITPLEGPFPREIQRLLAERLMAAVGFDFTRGRLDVSLHPFCVGSAGEVRITTRYDEANVVRALMAVLHESGDALYEQGRPPEWRHQPVGAARGMSMHESQALLMEMQAGRSQEFVTFLAPLVREAFQGEEPAWSAGNLHRIVTAVEPGFIRVEADEVTYPAHILVRYYLEKAMIAGYLRVEDLTSAFNEGIRALLGLTVPNDR